MCIRILINCSRQSVSICIFFSVNYVPVTVCETELPELVSIFTFIFMSCPKQMHGVDGIPPKLLLEIVEQISIPFATVFNLSSEEGIVPLEWKEANIIPLFKKGSRNKSENYRPVSLTSVICKLLERLIKDHLVDFLVKNNLIKQSQYGFLKARICLTNMLFFWKISQNG